MKASKEKLKKIMKQAKKNEKNGMSKSEAMKKAWKSKKK